MFSVHEVFANFESLSARRAWIEIAYGALDGASEIVALRKESVDRNPVAVGSLSTLGVALRKESVDRNRAVRMSCAWSACRSPQGERG